MLSFDDMKRLSDSSGTIGQQLKVDSDMVMQETFDSDIQSRQCYIYDYYHDDQPELEYGYDPTLSKTKFPVKLKFIIKTYKSMSSDDPEYHIMFEPNAWNNMTCKPDWFDQHYGMFFEFPTGLYVDIPDDRGIYHKWICTYIEVANQFVKCGVLKCNYRFLWIEDDGTHRYKRRMWGVNGSQSSYTSGVWRDYKMQTYDEQDKFILPWNSISANLEHDTRLVISMLRAKPWTYIVTKVDDTTPKGLINFTVKQDKFEPEHDYVQLDRNASDYGDMFADYYSSTVTPTSKVESTDFNHYRLEIESPNYLLRLGSAKVLTAKVYDATGTDVTSSFEGSECIWNHTMEDSSLYTKGLIKVDGDYPLKDGNKFKTKFSFTGDEKYLNDSILVKCQIENLTAEILLDITAL